MSDYIGDKKKKPAGSGSSASRSGSSRGAQPSGSAKSGSQSRPKSTSGSKSSSGAKNSSAGRSGSAPKSGQSKTSQSAKGASSSAKKSSSQQSSRSTSAKSAYSGTSSRSSAGSKSSSAAKKTAAGGTAQKGSQSGAKRSRNAYSDSFEAKRNSRYEQDLHSSREALDIKRARRKRSYSRHRKLFNFMFYAAIFVAVMAVIIIMSVTVLFGIENIEVIGSEGVPYTAAQIISSCDVEKGQNLFTAPIEGAGEEIMTALPYIEECTVERKLPSTVVITVTSAEAVGVVTDEYGRRIILSTGMRALEYVVSEGDAAAVPAIDGIVVSPTSVGSVIRSQDLPYIEAAMLIVEKLGEHGLKLDSISFSSGGNISAVYDGRITLIIGAATNLDEKLTLAAMLINEGKITKHESGDLDLSMDGKAIFTPDYVKEKYGLKSGVE